MMTELEFNSLVAQGYNRIPLMLEAFLQVEPIFNQIAARNID